MACGAGPKGSTGLLTQSTLVCRIRRYKALEGRLLNLKSDNEALRVVAAALQSAECELYDRCVVEPGNNAADAACSSSSSCEKA